MRKVVLDILFEARSEIYKAIDGVACLSDTNALFVIDQLIVADAAKATEGARDPDSEVIAEFEPVMEPDDEEDASREESEEVANLRRKLAESERARQQDSKLIEGLHRQNDDPPTLGGA